MATTGKIIVNLEAQSAQLKKEVASAKAELSGFAKYANAAKELQAESRASGEASLERILKGAGAVGLATFAVEALGKSADAVTDSLKKMEAGTLSGGDAVKEMATKSLEAIPILGTVIKTAGSIGDAFLHAAVDLGVYLGASKSVANSLIGDAAAEAEAYRKSAEIIKQGFQDIMDKADMIGLHGQDKDLAKEANEYDKQQEAISKTLDEGLKAADGNYAAGQHANAQYFAALDDAAKVHEANIKAIEDEAAHQTEQRADEHNKTMAHLQDEDNKYLLQGRQTALEEAISLDAQKYKQLEDEAAAHGKELEKDKTPEEIAKIRQQTNDQITAIDRTWHDADIAAAKEANEKKIEDQKAFDAKMMDMDNDAAVSALRAQGKNSDADILEIQNRLAKEEAEVEANRQKARKPIQDDNSNAAFRQKQDANRRASEETEALEDKAAADIATTKKKYATEAADHQKDLDRQLAQSHLEILRAQGEAGDTKAAAEADRLERVNQLKEKEEDLLEILRKQTDLTQAQKSQIQDQVAALKKLEDAKFQAKKSDDEGLKNFAVAATRRHDFAGPVQPNSDAQKQLLSSAQAQEKHQDKIEWYQQQLYNFALQQQTGSGTPSLQVVSI